MHTNPNSNSSEEIKNSSEESNETSEESNETSEESNETSEEFAHFLRGIFQFPRRKSDKLGKLSRESKTIRHLRVFQNRN